MTENNAAQPGLNDTIRAVFLEHGFTIKEGQTDLKPYVYQAVHALLSKLRAEGVQAGDPRDVLSDTGHKEADRLIGRLTSADPDFDDCTDAAALLRRLVLEEIKGPDGYATWKDAAIAERLARAAMRPTDAIVAMAREGLEVYSGPNMNEHKVCAELVRLADTSRAALASAPASEDGLTAKQAWWAGYRAGKGLPPDTPRQDAVKVDISSARLVTHWPNGTPRDERDTASDPEGKLIHDPTEPLLAASAPVAGEARMPPGYSVKAVDGHGYRITPPTGSDWVAHIDTPAGDLIAALYAAPQASEAVRNQALDDAEEAVVTLYESDEPVYLPDIALAIRALKAQPDKDDGDCAKGGHVEAANQPETRADIGFGGGLLDCAKGAGDVRTWQRLTDSERDGFVGELVDYGTDFVSPLYAVVESIERRLREKNATPSVVKQSLTATQTGEKGESDE